MKSSPLFASLISWRTGIIVSAMLLIVVVGLSGIFISSTFAPFYLLGAMFTVYIGVILILNPTWALYSALFVALLPIGIIPENIQSIINRAIVVVAAGTWLFNVILNRRKVSFTASAIFMLTFIAWGALTLFWADISKVGLTRLQVYILRFLVFLFLIPNEIRTGKELNRLLSVMSLSGWLLAGFCAVALLNQGYIPGSRFKLMDANENSIGVLALLSMTAILIQSSQPSKYKHLRTGLATLFVFVTIGLIALSGSRGGLISLAITLTAFWVWKSSRPWAKLGFAIFILGVMIAPFIFETTLDRFLQLSGESVLGGREVLWKAAWQMIGQHPLGGVGIGNAPYSIVPYVAVLASTAGKDSVSLHNPILAIWSETGFLGLGLYLAALIGAVVTFIKQYLTYKRLGDGLLLPYFAFIASFFLGYMASWVKGGGMEADFTYFLLLGLLTIPSVLEDIKGTTQQGSSQSLGLRSEQRV